MNDPTWLYRRARDGAVEARLFEAGEAPDPAEDWCDSPVKTREAPPDPFGGMSKTELEAYALEKFGVDLDRRGTLKFLRAHLGELAAKAEEVKNGDDSA